jgi:hypothetical protein
LFVPILWFCLSIDFFCLCICTIAMDHQDFVFLATLMMLIKMLQEVFLSVTPTSSTIFQINFHWRHDRGNIQIKVCYFYFIHYKNIGSFVLWEHYLLVLVIGWSLVIWHGFQNSCWYTTTKCGCSSLVTVPYNQWIHSKSSEIIWCTGTPFVVVIEYEKDHWVDIFWMNKNYLFRIIEALQPNIWKQDTKYRSAILV